MSLKRTLLVLLVILVLSLILWEKKLIGGLSVGEPNRAHLTDKQRQANNEELQVVQQESTSDVITSITVDSCNVETLEKGQLKYLHQALRQQFLQWQKQQVDEQILDYVAFKLNLPVKMARGLRQGYKRNKQQPKFAEQDYEPASEQQQSALRFLLHSHDYQAYLTQTEGDFDLGSRVYNTELGSTFLLEAVIKAYLDDAEYIVNQLLDRGVEVHTSDLYAATEAGYSTATLQKMLQHSGVDPSLVHLSGSGRYSLVNQAVIAQQPLLIEFWLGYDSPVKTDQFSINGLDLLTKNYQDLSQEQVDSVYQQLSLSVKRARYASSHAVLQKIVSADVYQSSDTDNEYTLQFPKGSTARAEQLELELIQKVQALQLSSVTCEGAVQQMLAQLINDQKQRWKRVQKSTHKSTYKSVFERNKEIYLLEKQWGSSEELLEYLKSDQTLSGKTLIDNYHSRLRSREMRKRRASLEQIQESQQHPLAQPEVLEQLMSHVRNEDADGAIDILEQHVEASQDLINAQLHLLITMNGKLEEIASLLEQSTVDPQQLLVAALHRDNTPLIELLVEAGASLHEIDSQGDTTLIKAVMYRANNTIPWLVDQRVSGRNTYGGFDALDKLLKYRNSDQQQLIVMISHLLRADITIGESHREIVEAEIKWRKDVYKALIESYPELASN